MSKETENEQGSTTSIPKAGWRMLDIDGHLHLQNRRTKRAFRLNLTSAPYRVPLWPVQNVSVTESSEIDCGRLVSDLFDREYFFDKQEASVGARKVTASSSKALIPSTGTSGEPSVSGSTVLPATGAGVELACKLCGERFGRPCELSNHMKKHSPSLTNAGQKKGSHLCTCEFCKKSFSNSSNLNRHMKKSHSVDMLNRTI